MSKSHAPWTPAQVLVLNNYQVGKFHPYTCGGCTPARDLIATEEGWVCAWCGYKQDWCHASHFARPQ